MKHHPDREVALRPINKASKRTAGAKCNFALRPTLAGLTGAVAGLLLAAVPLWRQHARHSEILPAPAVPLPPPSFHDAWISAKSSGSKAGASLRAAELAETLTAAECRTAAEAALQGGHQDMLRDVLCRWAALEGSAAFAWMKPHKDSVECSTIADVFATWAAADPAGFATVVANDVGGISRDDLRTAVRTNAQAAAVVGKILAHPDAAAKSDPQPVPLDIQFLRSEDRAAAATRLLETTPPEKLEEVTTGILQLWDDPEAAGHWLNDCPDSPAKSIAAQAYALHTAAEDPDAALHWANTLPDPAARARTQRRVFTAWHAADPAAAEAWLPQSGWSTAQMEAARDIMAVAPAMR